jgi:hypothetical protein
VRLFFRADDTAQNAWVSMKLEQRKATRQGMVWVHPSEIPPAARFEEPPKRQDPDPRPARMVTVSMSRRIDSLAKLRRVGSLSEQQAEQATSPRPRQITKATEAWDLAADLLTHLGGAGCIEELPELEGIEQLQDWLPAATMKKLRTAYAEKRERVELLCLLPDWKREAAQEALSAIEERPELENVVQAEAPELLDAIDLLRLYA